MAVALNNKEKLICRKIKKPNWRFSFFKIAYKKQKKYLIELRIKNKQSYNTLKFSTNKTRRKNTPKIYSTQSAEG